MKAFLSRLTKTLALNFASRKFLMTLFALIYERWDHWANVACIYTFQNAAQLTAFNSQAGQHRWFLGTALLSYLGIQIAENFSKAAAAKFESVADFAPSTKSQTAAAGRAPAHRGPDPDDAIES
ncbi:hypothetical protein LBMAG57_38480 [Verrucomicrobiota bacterium]|nr:hypothetical protein LBMAG57_38480 [Verrucomicrobiota bacterium]